MIVIGPYRLHLCFGDIVYLVVHMKSGLDIEVAMFEEFHCFQGRLRVFLQGMMLDVLPLTDLERLRTHRSSFRVTRFGGERRNEG